MFHFIVKSSLLGLFMYFFIVVLSFGTFGIYRHSYPTLGTKVCLDIP